MRFDEKDKQILRHLLIDSRQSARQLAMRLDVSTVTTISRMKKLHDEKIIQGYSVLLDHELLGYDLTAIVEISTTQGKMLEIENEISKHENVIAIYDITGETDILLIAKFKERKLLSDFVKSLSALPNVEKTITHIVLNTIKEDSRLL